MTAVFETDFLPLALGIFLGAIPPADVLAHDLFTLDFLSSLESFFLATASFCFSSIRTDISFLLSIFSVDRDLIFSLDRDLVLPADFDMKLADREGVLLDLRSSGAGCCSLRSSRLDFLAGLGRDEVEATVVEADTSCSSSVGAVRFLLLVNILV